MVVAICLLLKFLRYATRDVSSQYRLARSVMSSYDFFLVFITRFVGLVLFLAVAVSV